MFLSSFPKNPKICVVRTLAAYDERTRDLRKSSQSLVSLIAPHKAISSQSVSRWLTRALRMAGIELGYSGHSTRGASTSATAAGGLSVDVILKAADCASAQTFERFYHREASRAAFARTVLNSVNSSLTVEPLDLLSLHCLCYKYICITVTPVCDCLCTGGVS